MNKTSDHSGRIRSLAAEMVHKHRMHIQHVIRENELKQFGGRGVICPVCNLSLSSFAPIYQWQAGDDQSAAHKKKCVVTSEAGRCPSCNSLQRHRLLWKFLHEQTTLFDGTPLRLLEMAPDLPFFQRFIEAQSIAYFPCDLDPQQHKYESFPGNVLKADLCQLPFDNGFFDVILCSHVLEHVNHDQMALQEMYRVMKSDGWGIFQSPVSYNLPVTLEDPSISSPREREIVFGQHDHLRRYGSDYPQRIAKAGFRVSEIDYVKTIPEAEVVTFGLDRFERIYLCKKQ